METPSFDSTLGALSLEEKVAQLLVFAACGNDVDPLLTDFMRSYGLGGLRISPAADRRSGAYVPPESPAGRNAWRPPEWREKLLDASVLPYHPPVREYAGFLNRLRALVFERRGLGLPLHIVADFESGGGNYAPRGLVNLPAPMGFGRLGDFTLIEDVSALLARQIKAIGIDWIHSPLVDVNVDPRNPEIGVRAFSGDPDVVVRAAAAQARGLAAGGVIGCLKHFPGRGDSAADSHFATDVVGIDRDALRRMHLKPYRELIAAGLAESVMVAHAVYPAIDGEIATVSRPVIHGTLREELGFQGVVTTDSMTMGGLMSRFTASEAGIRFLQAGGDLLLMKAENALRFELHRDVVAAVRGGRLTEASVDEAVLRVWRLKRRYGLFENGGVVDPERAAGIVEDPSAYARSLEASRRALQVLRDRDGLLPLDPGRGLLVVDRVTQLALRRNNDWNHPGLFREFLRERAGNFAYIDYREEDIERVHALVPSFLSRIDVIVVTAEYSRNDSLHNGKALVRSLIRYGKPIVLIANSPSMELLVPDEIGTVIVTYELAREQLQAAAEALFTRSADPTG